MPVFYSYAEAYEEAHELIERNVKDELFEESLIAERSFDGYAEDVSADDIAGHTSARDTDTATDTDTYDDHFSSLSKLLIGLSFLTLTIFAFNFLGV